MDSVRNVTVDNNWVMHIQNRLSFKIADGKLDKWAGIATCSLPSNSACSNITMTNNVVAGAIWAGFTAFAHRCGESATQKVFKNNVAHSVFERFPENGHGMIIRPDYNDAKQMAESCSEASNNFAYKNLQGIAVGYSSEVRKSVTRDLVVIDNRVGFAHALGARGNSIQTLVNENHNIKIYGEIEIPDCP